MRSRTSRIYERPLTPPPPPQQGAHRPHGIIVVGGLPLEQPHPQMRIPIEPGKRPYRTVSFSLSRYKEKTWNKTQTKRRLRHVRAKFIYKYIAVGYSIFNEIIPIQVRLI